MKRRILLAVLLLFACSAAGSALALVHIESTTAIDLDGHEVFAYAQGRAIARPMSAAALEALGGRVERSQRGVTRQGIGPRRQVRNLP